MSWNRKVLRVNLTAGTCIAEDLNMKWADDFLGSRGLGTKYFCEEVDAKVDPLSPENKMIMATGPLTGTMASTGGRYTVITKGPLTGTFACSNSGGYFGAELKFAGWDMIIFEGKSALCRALHKAELPTLAPNFTGKSSGSPPGATSLRAKESRRDGRLQVRQCAGTSTDFIPLRPTLFSLCFRTKVP
jgi:hypothetical protein